MNYRKKKIGILLRNWLKDLEFIKKQLRRIFAIFLGKSIDTVRKIQIKGKSRTYYYNDVAKNELMKKLAGNQLNQEKNSNLGRQAVKEVLSQKIN